MKKLLGLLVVAAVLGFLVSRGRQEGENDSAAEPKPAETVARTHDAGGDEVRRSDDPEVSGENRTPPARPSRPLLIAEAPQDPEPEAVTAPEEVAAEAVVAEETAVVAQATAEEPAAEPQETTQPTPAGVAEALRQARELREEGKLNAARKRLSRAYLRAEGDAARKLREALDPICAELIFNARNTDIATIHEVKPGQYLSTIARKYDVNWQLIARLNNMDENDVRRMRAGRQLKVITGTPSIKVWKGEFRLALMLDGVYVKEYMVGTGKNNKTPTGTFVVNNMMVRAPWTAPDGKVYHYGDEGYQLGERWIAFEDQPGAFGIGIHGTHDESSIGTMCSNGCLRMKNADVMELYDFVRNGTKVTIVE